MPGGWIMSRVLVSIPRVLALMPLALLVVSLALELVAVAGGAPAPMTPCDPGDFGCIS